MLFRIKIHGMSCLGHHYTFLLWCETLSVAQHMITLGPSFIYAWTVSPVSAVLLVRTSLLRNEQTFMRNDRCARRIPRVNRPGVCLNRDATNGFLSAVLEENFSNL